MFDWSKPLRTQDGSRVVVATGPAVASSRTVCLKEIGSGQLCTAHYGDDGKYAGKKSELTFGWHLVPNVERRWKWIIAFGEKLGVSNRFYKDQTEASGITLLVKCESLFEDTPISS